jgi:hypothetical protein
MERKEIVGKMDQMVQKAHKEIKVAMATKGAQVTMALLDHLGPRGIKV